MNERARRGVGYLCVVVEVLCLSAAFACVQLQQGKIPVFELNGIAFLVQGLITGWFGSFLPFLPFSKIQGFALWIEISGLRLGPLIKHLFGCCMVVV